VLSLIHTHCRSVQYAPSLLSLLCLQQSLTGNDLHWRTFPILRVPELYPCLSYQLLTATATRTEPQQSSNSLTLLHCTTLSNWTELGQLNHIASELTHWEHRLQHLFCCCLTSLRMWHVPLLHVCGPLHSKESTCYNTFWSASPVICTCS
jgi:hypothetical protein